MTVVKFIPQTFKRLPVKRMFFLYPFVNSPCACVHDYALALHGGLLCPDSACACSNRPLTPRFSARDLPS